MHGGLPDLIIDLTIILTAGGVTTLVFKKLKQPLVLGYILAGFLISPYVSLFPTVKETHNIEIWSQIGVVFLLFSLGLEFSFKKLTKVGGAASVTAIVEIIGIGFVGFMIGTLLGWSTMDSLFLGGMLSLSSTIIIIRAFDELGLKTEKFVNIVLGTLIFEDLLAIVLMVLLSTIATGAEAQNSQIFWSIIKLMFFLVLWFVSGIFFIPTLLKKTKKLMNDETLLIVSIALCLIMVVLAVQVGFSKELGAFIMGSILAETQQGEKIGKLVHPLKDLFGTIFFVSVGMLINPATIVEYIFPIILITISVIFVNSFITTTGAFLSGQPLKTSIQTGMSMAQIGEFSFIIATLGLSLGVISDFLYPIAVTVTALTTLTTPFMIKASDPFYNWLEQKIPLKLKEKLDKYTLNAQSASATKDWQQLIKISLTNSIIYSVIILSIIIASSNYLHPFIVSNFGDILFSDVLSSLITLALMSPFIWALIARNYKSELRNRLLSQEKYKHLVYAISLGKLVLAVFFIIIVLKTFYSDFVTLVSTILIFALLIVFRTKIQRFYNVIEGRFKVNLNNAPSTEQTVVSKVKPKGDNYLIPRLEPWNAHLTTLIVDPDSSEIGKQIQSLRWREQYGVNITSIKRGGEIIVFPKANEQIFPYDEITLIGTDEQLASIEKIVCPIDVNENSEELNITLQTLTIDNQSNYVNQSIKDSGLREDIEGIVVGVEREFKRHLNPESSWIFQEGDVVWVVGDKTKIASILDH